MDGLELEVITTVAGREIRTFADLDEVADQVDAHSAGSSTIIQYTARGEREPRRFIPVFYARGPKARNLLVRADGSIRAPADLIGKRVGVSSYTNTASIWIRGMLQHEYGVAPSDIVWVEGERDYIASATPSVRRVQIGQEAGVDRFRLVTMLKTGEIDALCWTGGGGYYSFHPGGPVDRFCAQQGGIQSLIADPEVILDYYRRTQMDHITETVAIRESVCARERAAPLLLLELFNRAARLVGERMNEEDRAFQRAESQILGRDPFSFELGNVERNSISALSQYNYEQEITPRAPSLDELVPSPLL